MRQDAAVLEDFDLQSALIKQTELPAIRPEAAGFKIFLFALILLFSAVALPWQGAAENGLTAENFLAVVNQDRAQNGLSALTINPKLQAAARAKAQDILNKGYFAHSSPSGTRPWDFIKSEGFVYRYAGENLAMNYTNTYELENDFLRSPEHRENLLSPLFSETGIAVVSGQYQGEPTVITVQMFAAPANQPVAIK